MNFIKIIKYVAIVYGFIVTVLILTVFTPKLIGEFKEQGFVFLLDILKSFGNWYDTPISFFFTYLIGYIVIWRKPIWGSAIIILGDILFFAFNPQNSGIFIFVIPTFFVAVFYILYWRTKNK